MAAALQAPVAQLDRVAVFETEGWRFEPVRARQSFQWVTRSSSLISRPRLPIGKRPVSGNSETVAEGHVTSLPGNAHDLVFTRTYYSLAAPQIASYGGHCPSPPWLMSFP